MCRCRPLAVSRPPPLSPAVRAGPPPRAFVRTVRPQDKSFFVFSSPLIPGNKEMGDHMMQHGDGVRDIAFTVDDTRAIYEKAVSRGAKSIRAPWEESDADGTVIMATIATYGDTHHTFVQRNNDKGAFLPGYVKARTDVLLGLLPAVDLAFVDHVVGNQPDQGMEPVCQWCVARIRWRRVFGRGVSG